MSSNSYDGEYMGRIIHKFGFVAVKGSSSRNAVRALLGLRRALDDGWTVAFTLDGPRGPRHKVKPGPVALARSVRRALDHVPRGGRSGLGAQHLGPADDSPAVFARADALRQADPRPAEASDEDVERYTGELQARSIAYVNSRKRT